MQKTIVVAAAVFLTATGVCLAQPPGITREMISRALPLEGAPKAEPGPYQVMSEPAFGSPGLQVYRPTALDAFPGKDTLPVMVWGNGGCGIDSKTFSGFITTIASHGILVVGTVPLEGAPRRQETADDMRAAMSGKLDRECAYTAGGAMDENALAGGKIAFVEQSLPAGQRREVGGKAHRPVVDQRRIDRLDRRRCLRIVCH